MYNWDDKSNQTKVKHKQFQTHNQFDSQNPTFSSSYLDQINQTLIKSHPPKSIFHQPDHELTFLKNRGRPFEEDKMPPLPKPRFVDKWTEKKVNETVVARRKNPSFSSLSSPSSDRLDELDLKDTLFFSSSETEYSVFQPPKCQKFAAIPPRPKIDLDNNDKEVIFVKTRSRAHKLYSNMKNLKQPISPGARLTSLISSLFVKEGKTKKAGAGAGAGEREEWESDQGSMCSSTTSFCLSRNSSNKSLEDGVKRTVRFSPVGVIVGEDYEEQRKKLERESERDAKLEQQKQRQLEEMALDLLNGYWDSKLNVSHNQIVKDKVNHDHYGVNHDDHYDDDHDDGISCSSSDLFELDHLSLIGDELPVYETTHFDPKIM